MIIMTGETKARKYNTGLSGGMGGIDDDELEIDPNQLYVQWTTTDASSFFPASRSVGCLPPGLFEIRQTSNGQIFFDAVPLANEGLIKFPETASQKVVDEIITFWEREELFKKYKLAFKRGILLYGPAGSGKTCVVKLAIEDLIRRRGVVIKFTHPPIFAEGLRIFREIQPRTPVIVLMEDIDSIIEHYCESEVINILDGVDMIEKVCFIATTNYPEKLGQRITCRPSRFDKRFLIGLPSPETRRIYLKSLMCMKNQFDINKWVEDTDTFSIAHLKELFVAVNVLGDKYEDALKTLKEMSHRISSENDGEKMGLDVDDDE
jgi:SpoVK/Ycf46/Vps4 family AAA+-type ATPase